MTHGKINEIQDILTEVDTLLPTKLAALGIEIHHVLLAITPPLQGGIAICHRSRAPKTTFS